MEARDSGSSRDDSTRHLMSTRVNLRHCRFSFLTESLRKDAQTWGFRMRSSFSFFMLNAGSSPAGRTEVQAMYIAVQATANSDAASSLLEMVQVQYR